MNAHAIDFPTQCMCVFVVGMKSYAFCIGMFECMCVNFEYLLWKMLCQYTGKKNREQKAHRNKSWHMKTVNNSSQPMIFDSWRLSIENGEFFQREWCLFVCVYFSDSIVLAIRNSDEMMKWKECSYVHQLRNNETHIRCHDIDAAWCWIRANTFELETMATVLYVVVSLFDCGGGSDDDAFTFACGEVANRLIFGTPQYEIVR